MTANTGSFNTFASVRKTVSLIAGMHVLRSAIDAAASNGFGGGFDRVKLTLLPGVGEIT